MISDIKQYIKNFFGSRLFVVSAVFILLFAVILGRVFSLQIIHGKTYRDNFAMKIQKTLSMDAARGNIYDCNGKLLAYNELAFSISITDSAKYSKKSVRNQTLNEELNEILEVLEENHEHLNNNFKISYQDGKYRFNVSGNSLNRFRADVFGRASVEKLQYNEQFGFDELNATADQVMTYLRSSDVFGVDESYSPKRAYEIVVIRYAMQSTFYTRYRSTTIAEDVSDKTVAYIKEHMDTLVGVEVEEDTIRRYNYSEYFSSIIGYTGKISDTEYEQLSAADKSYTSSDTIGKAGLEQFYESYLRGTNGEQKVYVDNLGRVSEVISSTNPSPGADLYISVDAELQKVVYLMLEEEIAGIVYSNIKKNNIPISDVYFALINNSVIDVRHFDAEDATDTERLVQQDYEQARDSILAELLRQLTTEPVALNQMTEEILDDVTLIISMLKEDGILLAKSIDENDEVYQQWKNQKISPKEYLSYCIAQHWIDISLLEIDEKYADSEEIYEQLCSYILTHITDNLDFVKTVYEYMIKRNEIAPKDICLLLFEQGVLDYDDDTISRLREGTLTPYQFLLDAIDNIEITPAQLALDPCTGSCVITDVKTGEIKALVSYPGYDNNRLANGVDAEYFESLRMDKSNPWWNYATQECTAPGSTFKMVTATAGLAEHIISIADEIQCTGIYRDISNEPTCWIYPGNHGQINVSEAIRDSCNVFFYTLGYKMAQKDTGTYNDSNGISYIQKYASLYGLDQKTGLEIEEYTPSIATKYPVMAAIGQSNNNYTTASLSRYVTAVTSGKLYSYQLMNKIVGEDGTVLKAYESDYKDISDTLSTEQWSAIHQGMRMVVENLDSFEGFDIPMAGKTGTAQQVETRPNHALFVGFAPYHNPEITIATRIAYGYSSHNAASVSRNIISYYYGKSTLEDILKLKASGVNGSSNNVVTD